MFVYWFVTKVTSPNEWSECWCVSSGKDLTRRPPLFVRSRVSQAAGSDDRLDSFLGTGIV